MTTEGMKPEDMKNVTRRQLAGAVAVSLAAARAMAQTPAGAPGANPDWDQAARDSHKKNSMILAGFEIPMSAEPAFQFKA